MNQLHFLGRCDSVIVVDQGRVTEQTDPGEEAARPPASGISAEAPTPLAEDVELAGGEQQIADMKATGTVALSVNGAYFEA